MCCANFDAEFSSRYRGSDIPTTPEHAFIPPINDISAFIGSDTSVQKAFVLRFDKRGYVSCASRIESEAVPSLITLISDGCLWVLNDSEYVVPWFDASALQ
ncbi:hypothetical protein M8J76_008444 [Diaphorina citri]|nr:hypothetical protein M8J76_008444 [Diaphorina citri]